VGLQPADLIRGIAVFLGLGHRGCQDVDTRNTSGKLGHGALERAAFNIRLPPRKFISLAIIRHLRWRSPVSTSARGGKRAFVPQVSSVSFQLKRSALSSEGLSVSLPKCLDGRSARMLCAVALRPLLSVGNGAHIDGSATEARCLIADIEQRCRGPIVWR
jgi:hypothetical protein